MLDPTKLSSYDYPLPRELIASEPVMPRENARLLVFHKSSGQIEHLRFGDLADVIPEGCAVVFNDTKVVKARIYGHKESGGEIELLLNTPLGENKFEVLIRGRVKEGSRLIFGAGLEARVVELKEDAARIVKFELSGHEIGAHELFSVLSQIGHVPLPPYIKRGDTKDDETWYQSIFARAEGAVAAPTASLHFSPEMIERIKSAHETAYLTLHVGAGTFKPVEVEDALTHKMHSEYYEIPPSTQALLRSDKKILGVGTTVTRCVEYFARNGATSGFCDLFLHPQNRPIRQDYLLTNFHLPKSTLIMLVAAFAGLEETLEIYRVALAEKYRFYSYGDGMLVI